MNNFFYDITKKLSAIDGNKRRLNESANPGVVPSHLDEEMDEMIQFVSNDDETTDFIDEIFVSDGTVQWADDYESFMVPRERFQDVMAAVEENGGSIDVISGSEQLDELSKGTLGSYVKKAARSAGNDSAAWGYLHGRGADSSEKSPVTNKVVKREKGIDRAVDRLTREEDECLTELSKDTLGSYVKKASQDAQDAAYAASSDHGRGYDSRGDRHYDHAEKRQRGIGRAVDKLTREAEQLDELSKGTLGSYAKKAATSALMKGVVGGTGIGRGDYAAGDRSVRKASNRTQGVHRAVDRLTHGYPEKDEQLDELSKDALGSYVGKANRSRDNAHEIGNFVRQNPGRDANADHRELDHLDNRKIKRTRGIEKATGKLAKECGMNEHGSGVESMKGTWQSHMHEEADIEGLISGLRKAYANIDRVDPASPVYAKLIALLDGLDQEHLQTLADAGVKFVSMLAKRRIKQGEQLDELSKDTLKSYTKKASRDRGWLGTDVGSAPDDSAMHKVALRQMNNRQKGVERAVDKLTKECSMTESHDDWGLESWEDVVSAGLSMLNDGMPIRDILNMFQDEGLINSKDELHDLINALKNKGGSVVESYEVVIEHKGKTRRVTVDLPKKKR